MSGEMRLTPVCHVCKVTIFTIVLCFLAIGNETFGATLRVPSDYPTIQAAIDASVDGDVVLVAPGTYSGDGNRDIDFRGKDITLRSEQGPETCIINCGGPYPAYTYWLNRGRRGYDYHRAFYFGSHQAANSLVQGFTVTGAAGVDTAGGLGDGGAFYCADSRLTIRDCIIISNAATRGGGIYAYDSRIGVDDCVIMENVAYGTYSGTGGGVWISGGGVCFSNCRITGNVASHGGGGISCHGSHWITDSVITGNRTYSYGSGVSFSGIYGDISYVFNSTIWGNTEYTTATGFTENDIAVGGGGILGEMSVEAAYSLIGADSNSVGDYIYSYVTGQWFHGDPLFVSPGYWDPNGSVDTFGDDFWVEGDYHLKSQAGRWDPDSETWVIDDVTSPCIDAGDPNSPIGLEPFPNGGYVNIGAYGGTAEASKSYFGEPLCKTIMAGDINGDCRVDLADLLFVIKNWQEEPIE